MSPLSSVSKLSYNTAPIFIDSGLGHNVLSCFVFFYLWNKDQNLPQGAVVRIRWGLNVMFNKYLVNSLLCTQPKAVCLLGLDWPVNDALALQVVQGHGQLTDEELHSVFLETDVLLQVITQVPTQQEVHYHEHVFLILEGVPGIELEMKMYIIQLPTEDSQRQMTPYRSEQSASELRGQVLGVGRLYSLYYPGPLVSTCVRPD